MFYRQTKLVIVSRFKGKKLRLRMSKQQTRIYMDYQASTPIDKRVAEVMHACYGFAGNPHASEHAFGWDAHAAIERATSELATVLNVDEDEIIYTSGATESNNQAIIGIAENAPAARKRILISSIEHACVYSAARIAAKRYGCTVEILPVDVRGIVDLDYIEGVVGDDTLIISVMAVNNEIGTIQPIEEIGRICKKVGAIFHTDATHKLGTGRFDASVADMVSLSSHKIYGPKGIGALYISRPLQRSISPLIHGGGQQNGLRAGTLPVPLCAALARAATLMVDEESAAERLRIQSFRNQFVKEILSIDDSFFENGISGALRHPGNTNICFKGMDAQSLLTMLQPNIAASTGSACHSGTTEPSHVLRSIGRNDAEASASIRFGFGRFTNEEEIDAAVAIIAEAIERNKAVRIAS
jgi:cysteine desulfurase